MKLTIKTIKRFWCGDDSVFFIRLWPKGMEINRKEVALMQRCGFCIPFLLAECPVKETFELVKHGADINQKDNDGLTALALTARWNQLAKMKLLISLGAKINIPNTYSALHNAVYFGNIACINLLLKSGANVNAKDKDGYTPLSLAKKRLLYGFCDTAYLFGSKEIFSRTIKILEDAGGKS